eukprot:5805252-Amphidinium_carterae.1
MAAEMQDAARQLAERMQAMEAGYSAQVQQLNTQVAQLQQQLATASTRLSDPAARPPVIDTKLLGKPEQFAGTNWKDWSVVMRSYASVSVPLLRSLMERAHYSEDDLHNVVLSDEETAASSQLSYMLIMTCRDAPLTRVINAGEGQGPRAHGMEIALSSLRAGVGRSRGITPTRNPRVSTLRRYTATTGGVRALGGEVRIHLQGQVVGCHTSWCCVQIAPRGSIETARPAQPRQIGLIFEGEDRAHQCAEGATGCQPWCEPDGAWGIHAGPELTTRGKSEEQRQGWRQAGLPSLWETGSLQEGSQLAGGKGGKAKNGKSGQGANSTGNTSGNKSVKCWNCGKRGHTSKECRGARKGVAAVEEVPSSAPGAGQNGQNTLSGLFLATLQMDVISPVSGKKLTLGVDSGAAVTVVPEALARDYTRVQDDQTGTSYETATGQKLKDQGQIKLVGKDGSGEVRCVRARYVSGVNGKDVSHAMHKLTGKRTPFELRSRTWNIGLDLLEEREASEFLSSVGAVKREPSHPFGRQAAMP